MAEQITVEQAQELAEAGTYVLDVREHNEWDAGHAPGAVHIQLGELNARHEEIPKDATVLVICRSGARSDRAADALARVALEPGGGRTTAA